MRRGALVIAAVLLVTLLPAFAEDDIQQPPPPGERHEIKFPEPAEKTLANGLRVIVVEREALPIISVELVVKSGGEVDPPGAAGAMEMVASLLTRGAGKRTAPQVAQAIEALGGAIDTAAAWDATTVNLTIMSAQADAALGIFADITRRPSFAPSEVERLRGEMLDELRVKMEELGTLAKAAAARAIFGESPYGHSLAGTPKSIAKIGRAQIARLHAEHFRPDNSVLIFAGALTAGQGFAWAEKFFGDWKNSRDPLPATRPADLPPEPRVIVIDMPVAGQAAVILGTTAIARGAPDYFPGVVASAVLGGGYSARLNEEIRVKRGLTYGASSEVAARRRTGSFLAAAQTKNSAGPEVATLMRKELNRLCEEPVPAGELAARVATLTGEYGRSLETNEGFAARIGEWAALGVPLSMLNSFIGNVTAVHADAVQKFAGEHLRAAETSVVIAGRAEDMRVTLGADFPTAEIIPQKALDHDSISLRAPSKPAEKR